jgi:hypothetical protein
MIGETLRRVLSSARRREIDSGLDEEIQFHIERQTEKNLRQGMSPAEARRNAMVKFGGVERIRESTRDEYRSVLLEDVARDRSSARVRCCARPGLRRLRFSRWVSALARRHRCSASYRVYCSSRCRIRNRIG